MFWVKTLAKWITGISVLFGSLNGISVSAEAVEPLTVLKLSAQDFTARQFAQFPAEMKHAANDAKILWLANALLPDYINGKKMGGPLWLQRTDFSIQLADDYNPRFFLETIQPLSMPNLKHQWFWQGRFAHQDSRNNTVNVGLGWRSASADQRRLFGWNTFYDYSFRRNHARLGMGVEYYSYFAAYRANFYWPLTRERTTGISAVAGNFLYEAEAPVQGMDYELGTALPHAPWLNVYLSGFYFDYKHHEDDQGYRLRGNMQMTPRINLELGYFHSSENSKFYGQFTYSLADHYGPSLWGGHAENETHLDFSDRFLMKVSRDSEMRLETFSRLAFRPVPAVADTLKITLLERGEAIDNASVVLSLDGQEQSSVTNSQGLAVFHNVSSAGTYMLRIAKSGYVSQSVPLTLVAGQIEANLEIILQPAAGSATIRVISNFLKPVEGATVAMMVDGQPRSVITDEQGEAIFADLPAGLYSYTVEKADCQAASFAVEISGAAETSTTAMINMLTGDADINTLDFISRKSIPDVIVYAVNNALEFSAVSGADGVAHFYNLPVGIVEFRASKPGYIGASDTASIHSGAAYPTTISLFLRTLDPAQSGKATISIMSQKDYAPIGGAVIQIKVNGQLLAEGISDILGKAYFDHLPPGPNTIMVSKDGYVQQIASIYVISGGTASKQVLMKML